MLDPPAAISPVQAPSPSSPPLPVQPLAYAGLRPDTSDPWRQDVNAFALAAILYGATSLAMSVETYIQEGWRLLPSDVGGTPMNVVFFLLHIISDVGSLGLIIASAGCARRRAWALRVMVLSSAAIAFVLVALPLLYDFVWPGRPSRQMLHFVIQTVAWAAQRLIFPALLIWLMTRPAVRRQFGRRAGV